MSGYRLPELFAQLAAEQDALAAQPLPGLAEKVMRAAWDDTLPPMMPVVEAPLRPRRRLFQLVGLSAAFGFASVAILILALRSGKPMIQASVGQDPVAAAVGTSLVASQDATLPLHFSDGSHITFRPSARAHIARLTQAGAEMVLESGEIVAHIQHLPGAAWQVTAGPFRVVVTGTRFLTGYLPEQKALTVRLYEGSVIVHGPSLGNGTALVAGQMLEARAGQPVTIRQLYGDPAVLGGSPKIEPMPEPLPEPMSLPQPDADPEVAEPVVPADVEPAAALAERASTHATHERAAEWIGLAERGRYEAAFTAAERLGFSELCRRLPARRLLSLGDVARFAGKAPRTQEAYEALVRRFPKDRFAADAMFGLGRLFSEGGQPDQATVWFERYLAASPKDSLAEQAMGRLLELYPAVGNRESAARIAQQYLARYPSGMRQVLAKRILAGQGREARR